MTVFATQAVTLNGTQFSGITGAASNRERKIRADGTDGTVHKTLRSPIRTAPKATLRTVQLKTWIAALNDSTDIMCKALDAANGLVLWGAKMDNSKPGYLGTSVHSKRTGLRGLVCADSIEWSPGNAAELALSAYFKCTDGTTDPLSDVTNGTLPAQPVPAEALVLASLTRGGVTINDIGRFMIKIDHKTSNDKDPECYSAGLPHPVDIVTAGANDNLDITVDLDTTDEQVAESAGEIWVATYKLLGQGAALVNSGVIITLNNVYAHDGEVGGYPSKTKKVIGETRYDGVNKPMTWSTF